MRTGSNDTTPCHENDVIKGSLSVDLFLTKNGHDLCLETVEETEGSGGEKKSALRHRTDGGVGNKTEKQQKVKTGQRRDG